MKKTTGKAAKGGNAKPSTKEKDGKKSKTAKTDANSTKPANTANKKESVKSSTSSPKGKDRVSTSPEKTSKDTGPLFFFKANEPFGEFCQWYPATFTVSKETMTCLVGHPIDDDDPEGWQTIFFHSAEQFMMYCKAGRFHDTDTQRKILATRDPKEQKRLGRQTRGFQAASWDDIKSDVVVQGNMAKFGQNPALRKILLGTGDRLLAEAASEDRVWGIGFSAKEATMHADQSRWGENRLGKALMEARKRLRQGEDGGM